VLILVAGKHLPSGDCKRRLFVLRLPFVRRPGRAVDPEQGKGFEAGRQGAGGNHGPRRTHASPQGLRHRPGQELGQVSGKNLKFLPNKEVFT